MDTKLLSLPIINDTFPEAPTQLINREGFIDALCTYALDYDVIFVDGISGVGKTTFLSQFCTAHPFNCIAHFVIPSYMYTYRAQCIEQNLFNQIYYYCFNEKRPENEDSNLDSIWYKLLQKVNKENRANRFLYFVFDGFADISTSDMNLLKNIFDQLPWGKAKFIFSGNDKVFSDIVPAKMRRKTIDIIKFSYTETAEYLKDMTTDSALIREIYKISLNGHPERLTQIKRQSLSLGSIKKFLDTDINENTDLFNLDWESNIAKDNNSIQLFLSLIAYSDYQLTKEQISVILKIDIESILEYTNSICFLMFENGIIEYISEKHKIFAQRKTLEYKEEVFNLLMNYYEEHLSNEESIFNLPNLYQKAQSWTRLTKFLNLEAFIKLIERYQSLGNIKRQFEFGYDASKHISSTTFNSDYLRFSLHKSSILELEKCEVWSSEIEARIALEEYEHAYTLANSALLKEDKLRLLSTIAKERKKNNLPKDELLSEKIKDLYDQIDFSLMKEKGLEIAQLLIYSSFDLALDLIDKITNTSAGNESMDRIYAYLSLFVKEENKRAGQIIADPDLISSKIQDGEIKKLTTTLSFLSSEYSAIELIEKTEELSSNTKKLFLLRNWILSNEQKLDIEKVIEYAINLIIKDSDKNTPNASVLSDIAKPLPIINNELTLNRLIGLFDTQKQMITTPSRDFITLQLSIAEALFQHNIQKSKDRFYEIYFFIEEVEDLSVKTDCLALLWNKLIKIDKDDSIEKSITTTSTIKQQLTSNIDLLLEETAYHLRMVEFVIKTLITCQPLYIFDQINKLNTLERRDDAYTLAMAEYIENSSLENIDFLTIDKYYSSIADIDSKEYLVEKVIMKIYLAKEQGIPYIPEVKKFFNRIISISHLEERCILITRIIKILSYDERLQKNEISFLTHELEKSWAYIDVPWRKIELGFSIARNMSFSLKDVAKKYLEEATLLKYNEILSSASIVNTYMMSTKLCIRAFGGLIASGGLGDVNATLDQINEVITRIHSYGEELKLWNKVALHFLSYNDKTNFENIFNNKIAPLLSKLDKNDSAFYRHIIVLISPSIFLHNQTIFKDYLLGLTKTYQDYCISNICEFIFTKYCYEEHIEDSEKGYALLYTEYIDIVELIKLINSDSLLYDTIKKVAHSIKENKERKLSNEQKKSLVDKIDIIIDEKLPNSHGIKHKGYWILCKALVLSINSFQTNQNKWNDLINESNNINNLSDKAFVKAILSSVIDKRSIKISMLEESFNLTKLIPANYDKSNRFDISLNEWINIDKGSFSKHMRIAYEELISNKDGNSNNIKSLIDVAQQYDEKLATELVDMLDIDPARQKYKKPIQKRLERNKKLDAAKEDLCEIKKLNDEELKEFFEKNISQLQNEKITTKKVEDMYPILERSSMVSLSDSYSSFAFFIENIIKKNQISNNYSDVIKHIYIATYENAKLVGVLSSDNITKMKNLYNPLKKTFSSPIIRYNETAKAKAYIREWVKNNVKKELKIIDPYFTEKELDWLLLLKEINNDISISILTSKLNGNNNYEDNKSEYDLSWKKISRENPPETTINIIWGKTNMSCPFHDRWWIADSVSAGLSITSINGIANRDSQILEMDENALINIEELINDYMYKRVKYVRDDTLKYEYFELND